MNVWLIEDDARWSCANELREDGHTVTEFSFPTDALSARGRPDVIIFDLGTCGIGGTAWDAQASGVRFLLDRFPSAHLALMSGMGPEYCRKMAYEIDERIIILDMSEDIGEQLPEV